MRERYKSVRVAVNWTVKMLDCFPIQTAFQNIFMIENMINVNRAMSSGLLLQNNIYLEDLLQLLQAQTCQQAHYNVLIDTVTQQKHKTHINKQQISQADHEFI